MKVMMGTRVRVMVVICKMKRPRIWKWTIQGNPFVKHFLSPSSSLLERLPLKLSSNLIVINLKPFKTSNLLKLKINHWMLINFSNLVWFVHLAFCYSRDPSPEKQNQKSWNSDVKKNWTKQICREKLNTDIWREKNEVKSWLKSTKRWEVVARVELCTKDKMQNLWTVFVQLYNCTAAHLSTEKYFWREMKSEKNSSKTVNIQNYRKFSEQYIWQILRNLEGGR